MKPILQLGEYPRAQEFVARHPQMPALLLQRLDTNMDVIGYENCEAPRFHRVCLGFMLELVDVHGAYAMGRAPQFTYLLAFELSPPPGAPRLSSVRARLDYSYGTGEVFLEKYWDRTCERIDLLWPQECWLKSLSPGAVMSRVSANLHGFQVDP